VEGIVTWLVLGDLYLLMMNEYGPGIKEILSMFITTFTTALDVLSEHNFIRMENPPVPSVGLITLLLINSLKVTASDFDIEKVYEIVRAADQAGVKLKPRKEAGASQGDLGQLRAQCEEEEARKFD